MRFRGPGETRSTTRFRQESEYDSMPARDLVRLRESKDCGKARGGTGGSEPSLLFSGTGKVLPYLG